MPVFSPASTVKLRDVHPELQRLCNALIEDVDFLVVTGHRDQADQDEAYAKGYSQVKWPYGKHNSSPSRAVDLKRWPIDWDDVSGDYYFAGWVMATAKRLGIALRWGGDWDGDQEVKDNGFNDLGHFELMD